MKIHRFVSWFAAVHTSLAFASVAAAAVTDFKAGMAIVDITPPRGWRLAGDFTERVSTNTLSPLHARAVVFQQGRERAAVVICDLLDVGGEIAHRARLRASQRGPVPYGNILIAATRTPNGPLLHGAWRQHLHTTAAARDGRDFQEGIDFPSILAEQIGDLICQAARSTQPARIEAGRTGVLALAAGSDDTHDDFEMGLLLVLNEKGGTALASLSTAPLPAGWQKGRSHSAGYPYVLEQALRKTLGAGFISLAAISTQSRAEPLPGQSSVAAESEWLGAALGQTVLGAIPTLKPVRPALSVRSTRVPVSLGSNRIEQVLAAREKLPRVGKGTLTPSEESDICRILDQHQQGRSDALLEVQVVKLGADTALVGLPVELPSDLALTLKRGSPFKNTLLVAHCQESFATSCAAGLSKSVHTTLASAAVELLSQMK